MLKHSGTKDESALLASAQAGDGDALSQLLTPHFRQAYSVALRITRNHHDAEDVLQESQLHACTRLSQFRGDCRFATWLLRIVVHQAVTELRRRASRREISLEHVVESDDERLLPRFDLDPREGPEILAVRAELRRILATAIERLDRSSRVVIVMREIAGLSMEEIASASELSVAAVKGRLFRGRRQLYRWISARFGNGSRSFLFATGSY